MLTPVTDSMTARSPPPVAAPQPVVPFTAGSVSSRRYDVEAESYRSSSSRKRRHSDISMSSSKHHHQQQQSYPEMNQSPGPMQFKKPPPPAIEKSKQHSGARLGERYPEHNDTMRAPEVEEDQDFESSSSASGTSSAAEDSPRQHVPSLSQVSPRSHSGSIPQLSSPRAASNTMTSRPHFSPQQASFVPSGSRPTSTPSHSYSASRDQPSNKRAKEAHEATYNDENSRRDEPASYARESASSAHTSGGSSASAFANYRSPATFNIPTASTPAPENRENKRKSSQNQRATAASGIPTALPQTEADTAVSTHLRSLFKAEAAWNDFIESRKKVLSVAQQMKQLVYVQGKIDQHAGQPVPEDVNGASGTTITKVRFFSEAICWMLTIITRRKSYEPSACHHCGETSARKS